MQERNGCRTQPSATMDRVYLYAGDVKTVPALGGFFAFE